MFAPGMEGSSTGTIRGFLKLRGTFFGRTSLRSFTSLAKVASAVLFLSAAWTCRTVTGSTLIGLNSGEVGLVGMENRHCMIL